MGWFDEKRTYVSSSYLPLIEYTPDIVKQSVLDSIMCKTEIVPDLMDTLNASIATKLYKYYKHASKATNQLVVPRGITNRGIPSAGTVTPIINARIPTPSGNKMQITGMSYGGYSEFAVTQEAFYLDPNLDFITASNSFTDNRVGPTIYAIYDTTIVRDNVIRVSGRASNGSTRTVEVSFPYKLFGPDLYLTVEFYFYPKDIDPSIPRNYYTYHVESDKYPQLSPAEIPREYVPIMPLRIRNRSVQKSDSKYKDIKKALDILGINLEELVSAIEDSPSIKEVDHAYFMLGCDPWADNSGANQYMYEFFLDMSRKVKTSKATFLKWYNEDQKQDEIPLNELAITDGTFKGIFSWHYIEESLHSGSIGQVGTVTKSINAPYGPRKDWIWGWYWHPPSWESVYHPPWIENVWVPGWIETIYHPQIGQPGDPDYQPGWFETVVHPGYMDQVYHPGYWEQVQVPAWSEWRPTKPIMVEDTRNTLTLRKQLDSNTYRQFIIPGLMFSNQVYGGDLNHFSTLQKSRQSEQQKVLIPLDVDLSYNVSATLRSELMYSSFHLVVNAINVVTLKWYETSFFSSFVKIIGIAITIFTFGSDGGLGMSLAMAASTGISAVASLIAEMILTNLVISSAFKFAAETLGLEFAMVFAAVASIYAMAGSDMTLDLPFADDALLAATGLQQGIGSILTEELTEISAAQVAMVAEQEEMMEELESINKELNKPAGYDVMNAFRMLNMLPSESPSAYLTRTTGTSMYNIMSIDAISNYVDNSLRLPTDI